MFREILYTQWRTSQLFVLFCFLAGFAIPVLSVQDAVGSAMPGYSAPDILAKMESWSIAYPLLAMAVGLVIAMTSWAADHRSNHVYALSLPLPRWMYALHRFGAGLLLLGTAILGVFIGALVTSLMADLPVGLETYPMLLTLRFGVAAMFAYSVFFAISAGTSKTAGYVLAVVAGILLVDFVLKLASVDVGFAQSLFETLARWPGPFEVFTGRWMLIDV